MRQYNGRQPETWTIEAGTELHRISGSGSSYDPNSFNMTVKALGDPDQGRFEPIDNSHGGYLYVAETIEGAVAEGILRNQKIPKSGLIRAKRVAGRTHTVMVLKHDIEVAVLMDGELLSLNLDGDLLNCGSTGYDDCRSTCHEILSVADHVDGVVYRCRHNGNEKAFMLLDRGSLSPASLDIVSSVDIMSDPDTLSQISKVLLDTFRLQFVAGPASARVRRTH
ncbi:RES family NAD+ phosphorylase [Rhodococcus sp. IEGM 1351]|uniref:RES family NAD+ phosphorylase n=1 Tax=Rhodococcus sp. IEGM 1351 TaxID=3047089 RepID=UPI0024B71C8A|nr:RES family NAD+ phosphorylase [Rhodococcus sp. IEGM 1351]MDI9940360.1 RES family NAD+ phosphorylase [Rhodococcus sp. IEGM 1351]